MGIVVIGDVFIDVKGYSTAPFIPGGRNAGVIPVSYTHLGQIITTLIEKRVMLSETIRKC